MIRRCRFFYWNGEQIFFSFSKHHVQQNNSKSGEYLTSIFLCTGNAVHRRMTYARCIPVRVLRTKPLFQVYQHSVQQTKENSRQGQQSSVHVRSRSAGTRFDRIIDNLDREQQPPVQRSSRSLRPLRLRRRHRRRRLGLVRTRVARRHCNDHDRFGHASSATGCSSASPPDVVCELTTDPRTRDKCLYVSHSHLRS